MVALDINHVTALGILNAVGKRTDHTPASHNSFHLVMKAFYPTSFTAACGFVGLIGVMTRPVLADSWSLTMYDDQLCSGNIILQDEGDENKECVPSLPQTAYSYRFTQNPAASFLFYVSEEQECGNAILSDADCPFSVTGFKSYEVGETP